MKKLMSLLVLVPLLWAPTIILRPGDWSADYMVDQCGYAGIQNATGSVEVNCQATAGIDILVLDEPNFHQFKNGSQFTFDPNASRLNVTSAYYTFGAPAGLFYLVVSNAGGIPGGAIPQYPAHISMTVSSNGSVVEGVGIFTR